MHGTVLSYFGLTHQSLVYFQVSKYEGALVSVKSTDWTRRRSWTWSMYEPVVESAGEVNDCEVVSDENHGDGVIKPQLE